MCIKLTFLCRLTSLWTWRFGCSRVEVQVTLVVTHTMVLDHFLKQRPVMQATFSCELDYVLLNGTWVGCEVAGGIHQSWEQLTGIPTPSLYWDLLVPEQLLAGCGCEQFKELIANYCLFGQGGLLLMLLMRSHWEILETEWAKQPMKCVHVSVTFQVSRG